MPDPGFPRVLPMRERAAVLRRVLEERLETVLPTAMREAGIDFWLVLCQEDDYDPVFHGLLPMDSWCPILQMLCFHDTGEKVERISVSMTNTAGLYDQPFQGRYEHEQWKLLPEVIAQRNPRKIGINTGSVAWAAGGLTHSLHNQLVEALGPELSSRLVSAEPLVVRWLSTLTATEIELFEHVVNVAHAILADCLSRHSIVPGVTTPTDLEWRYWQLAADRGLELSFKPFFRVHRSDAERERFGADDQVIRQGDMIHSDVGIKYLGLNSDHQQVAYVRRLGE
ncbi:MAG: Xaa-Pro aminopeptidase, partial [Armatimonadetes bacterium]|nr:Xaa-Pro aminopeptidase [Armatimonadota bacterium]